MNDTMSYAATDSRAPLTSLDRCDACGAQAYVRVRLEVGEFLFCAHHATKHSDKLRPQAIEWHDETSKLRAADARTPQPADD